MTITTPAAAWSDPDHDPDIRRQNMAERTRINTALSDAAQLLLSLREWASPEEATAMISAIQAVAYGHAQIMEACDAHETEVRLRHYARQRRSPHFAGLR
jgi:hypothetical protein